MRSQRYLRIARSSEDAGCLPPLSNSYHLSLPQTWPSLTGLYRLASVKSVCEGLAILPCFDHPSKGCVARKTCEDIRCLDEVGHPPNVISTSCARIHTQTSCSLLQVILRISERHPLVRLAGCPGSTFLLYLFALQPLFTIHFMDDAAQLRSISWPVIHAALLPRPGVCPPKHARAARSVLHQIKG